MKKLLITVISLGVSLFALPVGNPWDASLYCQGVFEDDCWFNPVNLCPGSMGDSLSVRTGFYGDYVYNRHLKVTAQPKKNVHEVSSTTNAGLVVLNFHNRFDLFATFGTSAFTITTNSNVLNVVDNFTVMLQTATNFSYNVGVRGTLWTCRCFEVGGAFQYFNAHPPINRVSSYPETSLSYANSNMKFKYQEWQFSLGAAYSVTLSNAHVIPYAGIKWAHAWTQTDGMLISQPTEVGTVIYDIPSMKNARDFGYALGLTLSACDKWTISLEGQFADELGLTFNTQFRF